MYRNFTVKNFRCFPNLLLNPLGQVNLIAGKNNTGKTALLEAIHLHSYPQNCDLPFAINEFRGTDIEKRYDEETCGWLFFDKQPAYGFETISQDENGQVRYLKIWLVDATTAREQFPEAEALIQQLFLGDAESSKLKPRKGQAPFLGQRTRNGVLKMRGKMQGVRDRILSGFGP